MTKAQTKFETPKIGDTLFTKADGKYVFRATINEATFRIELSKYSSVQKFSLHIRHGSESYAGPERESPQEAIDCCKNTIDSFLGVRIAEAVKQPTHRNGYYKIRGKSCR